MELLLTFHPFLGTSFEMFLWTSFYIYIFYCTLWTHPPSLIGGIAVYISSIRFRSKVLLSRCCKYGDVFFQQKSHWYWEFTGSCLPFDEISVVLHPFLSFTIRFHVYYLFPGLLNMGIRSTSPIINFMRPFTALIAVSILIMSMFLSLSVRYWYKRKSWYIYTSWS